MGNALPTPYVSVVLVLAAFRVTRLIGWDDLPPIARLRARMTGESVRVSSTEARGPIYSYRRPTFAHFLSCPYCVGFWTCLAIYLLWYWLPTETLYGAAVFALSGAVGITARILDP